MTVIIEMNSVTLTKFHVRIIFTIFVLTWISAAVSESCEKDTPEIVSDLELKYLSYSVVIDAGSSGSRIHVYKWKDISDKDGDKDLPDFHQIFCKRTSPGVSECKNNLEIRNHVVALVTAAIPHVPQTLRERSPVFFMATAGMRMMLEDKANDATKYIDELLANKTLNPFLYHYSENTRVLSGEEEGIFAWIAANYIGKAFSKYGNRSPSTRGILELGGASTQIAFVPKGNILDNKYPVTIAGVRYSLYVHSYLIYGQEQVDVWIKDKVYKNNRNGRDVHDIVNPCMLKGDISYKKIDELNITFRGSGEPEKCVKLLDELIYEPMESWRCNPKPCGIGSTYQPSIHPNMQFYVVGAFRYPIRAFGILKPDGSFSLQEATQAAFNFCRTSVDAVSSRHKNTPKRLLSRQCLTGLYMPILFTKAYKFKNDTAQLRAPHTSSSDEIEWPLGAVIYEYENQKCKSRCMPTGASVCSAYNNNSVSAHSISVAMYIVSLICGLFLILSFSSSSTIYHH